MEYNNYEEKLTDNNISEIHDFYLEIVDDLELIDTDKSKMMNSMESCFVNKNNMSIEICIRTVGHNLFVNEEREKYSIVLNKLNPIINRIKSCNYKLEVKDIEIKMDPWRFIRGGIKLIISY